MRFTKMEGCGNDYIYINGFEENVERPEKLAIAMSQRHFGVGSDGLVLILPSEEADFRMRMFNLDGSEGKMCGNAIRCIGKYVYERGLTKKNKISVETLGGIKYLDLAVKEGVVESITVDMDEPIFTAEQIPVLHETSPVIDKEIMSEGKHFLFTCLSMGNPHAVAFVNEPIGRFPVELYGKAVEQNSVFPEQVNVEFVEVVSQDCIKMRVWERGSGETMACGTGACAAAVAAILKGYCKRKVQVELLGGTLTIEWREEDNRLYMTGPAAFSFDGVWLKEI